MSKREYLVRYRLIINKLRRSPSSFKEINDYLQRESELQSYDFIVSLRTFQRDLSDIRTIYQTDIRYNASVKKYYIDDEGQPEVNKRIFEAFDTFNALQVADGLSRHIQFEKRKPQGTEHLFGLLHAIRNQYQIRFTYQKYWEEEVSHRDAEPYALKEFENRWYVLAKDLKDKNIKSFGLDRLRDLEITKWPFQSPVQFDINLYYENCFGIVTPDSNQKPQEIILSFDPVQGKYIKSLPLHESQEILLDTPQELRIRLKLYITYDLIIELLHFGDRLKIVQPQELIGKIREEHRSAVERYNN